MMVMPLLTYTWYDPTGTEVQVTPGVTSLSDTFSGSSTTAGLWECVVEASDGTDVTPTAADIEVDSDWDGALTFTNCGQTGYTGPSQSQCNSGYSSTTLDGLVTVLSGFQYWTVPSTGTYQITAVGAQGGYGANSTTTRGLGFPGGYGALMEGEFTLTAGEIIVIVVGQEGTDGIGNGNCGGGGGGGGICLARCSTNLLIAAGGGGGGPGSIWSVQSEPWNDKLNSLRLPLLHKLYLGERWFKWFWRGAGASSSGNTSCGYCGAGGAGWLSDGGTGGYYGNNKGLSRTNGFLGGVANNNQTNGGFGGGAATGDDGRSNYSHGNAGGGGYSGVGGTGYPYFGGGGGSYNGGSNQNNQTGVNTGHGYVIIDKL